MLSEPIAPEDAVFACVAILGGLFLLVAGYRLFRPAVFCTGVFLGYTLMYAILVNTAADDELAIVLGSLACGLACGVLLVWMVSCVAKAVLFLMGFLAGFSFALYIMAWAEDVFAESSWRWALLFGSAVLFGILAVCYRKVFVIASTSWYGAYYVTYGIDVFAQTGFSEAFHDLLQGDSDNTEWSNAIYGMLAMNFVLFFIGGAVQLFVTGKDHEEPEDDGYQRI